MLKLILIGAIILLMVGHLFKIMRWKQLYGYYEKPNLMDLTNALGQGYLINFILPFRIADIVRAYSVGKKSKNGFSLSLATVIWDRYFDFIAVGFIFFIINFKNLSAINSSTIYFYMIGSVLLILCSIIAIKFSKYPKILMKKISSVFNTKIQLNILTFFWSLITSFKTIIKNVNKRILIIQTILMWASYLSSYKLLAMYLVNVGNTITFTDVFCTLFEQNNILSSSIKVIINTHNFMTEFASVIAIYLLVTALLLILIGVVFAKKTTDESVIRNSDSEIKNILPHINDNDRLQFLNSYFSDKQKDFISSYIDMNKDIRIIEDYSAGSNATTMLCMNNDITFFRKYAYGKDKDKLYEQVQWLHNNEKTLPLTKIINERLEENYFCYDMEYKNNAVGLFNFIHSSNIDDSWSILRAALDVIKNNLHTKNNRPSDIATINKYIEGKVLSNITKIKNASQIKPLLKYEYLYINGKQYKNFEFFEKYLTIEHLSSIFKYDSYSDVHGDLTIENIIAVRENNNQSSFYIIDPNTGNVHDSPSLDLGKLLQSLHGGYEFLMKTNNVSIQEDNINYLSTRSSSYDAIFEKYKQYLEENYDKNIVKSIFYHEIIHWLRLMPYKIEKNAERAVLFYAGMIIVMNDVYNWFE